MDLVFKALADPTRRALLDELFGEDGQTLVSLYSKFDMTRVGIAKHLGLLSEAGLVTTQRRGREKLHYLNPVPIRLIHDRWVSKYTEAWTAGLVGLKNELEFTMEKVFEIYIRTTPERLWEAITDADTRRRFQFGNSVESEWTQGSSYAVTNRLSDGPLIEGENLDVDPPRRLVQSMHARWGEEAASAGTSRVTWEIEPVGDSCRLTVTHDQLPEDASDELYGGWPMILSGLKTWLETGEELTTPGSLMYKEDPS
ncbi:ArsR/SmtB family transcription factor [Aeromicrobium sp.]|uniref:ArsR/SmtB family transcription factor n=1 Tax=Aeromicrobium sp. TaxID=1871063 RepID=UPI003D6B467B